MKVWEMIGLTRSVTRGKTSGDLGRKDGNMMWMEIYGIMEGDWMMSEGDENLIECVMIPGRG